MKILLPLMLVVAYVPMCVSAEDLNSCLKVSGEMASLKEIDQPLAVSPQIPSSGFLSGVKMKLLVQGSGVAFDPGSLAESNCYLDRILDKSIRESIRQGAKDVATGDARGRDVDEDLELLFSSIAARLADVTGTYGYVAWLSVRSNIDSTFRLTTIGDSAELSRFAKFLATQGIYSKSTAGSYVLIQYINHLGVKGFPPRKFMRRFRELDFSYRPPKTLKAHGCAGTIEYIWPHLGLPVRSSSEIGEYDNVHFGVCNESQSVWYYFHKFGWRHIELVDLPAFCNVWGKDNQFASICSR